jgi:hypothetical protein
VNVECKDTQTYVGSSQYNINVPIKLSEANTNKMRVIARLKHKMFSIEFPRRPVMVFFLSCTCSI